jgi:hypothetical protein
MNVIFMLLVWLLVAFVVGIAIGKFCAVGSRRDSLIPEKMSIESETSVDNVEPQKDSSEVAA